MMTSYGRVPELLSQVRSMMDQTYKNFHMFVAVKGITEVIYQEVIVPQLRHYVNERRLSLCLTGNTNQLINFLDTIRGYPLDEYDLFLKIDDDDFYHPDYLKYYAETISMCPEGTSIYYGKRPTIKTVYQMFGAWTIRDTFRESEYFGYGHMLALGRPIIDHLFAVERKPSLLLEDAKLTGWSDGMNIGWREDRYIFEMMMKRGHSIDIAPVFEKAGITPSYIGGYMLSNSWTRNPEFRKSEFLQRVTSFENSPHPPREWFADLDDGRTICIFDGYYNYIGKQEKHRYTSFKNGRLELKNGKVYKRKADGVYYEEPKKDEQD